MYKKPDFEPSRDEMLRILENKIKPMSEDETVSVVTSLGRICAEDVYAKNTLPNKPVSARDGIAVHFSDFSKGIPDTSDWKDKKEYCFSNTGVAISDDYDTVITIENVEFDKSGKVRLLSIPEKCGEGVGVEGGQVKEGELLVYTGERISPSLIGILLTGGITSIKVLSKPKVAFIPTGDELVPAGYQTPPGKNVESNSQMLKAYINECGGEAILYPIIPDVMEKLKEAILSAVAVADLVLICAGSSKGNKDFTIELLESIGNVMVYELGHGPGKHCSLAYSGNTPIIGLPGPPMGADLTAALYVKNAMRLMQMQPVQSPYQIIAMLEEDINGRKIDFVSFMRVFIKDGQYYARPVELQGKTRAEVNHLQNGQFYLEKGSSIKAGTMISVEMRYPKEYITEE
ncbi:molybdopterin molybdenumtransferase MoeA [Acetobacterium fimetarium]|uniref:Molybdopterin molybdenumtransferase n=1 Tax=Acetobacterium fimetarium TaxID=52691 RepID=A0ABR6WV22_9FIRM|nr:molybdopterin molybdotransferase MoeA [Acetobacterium fimetarium]MBC3804386.1 molybdopterin molybdenumtransferase MoeA [Acetobacterium fimetarium]